MSGPKSSLLGIGSFGSPSQTKQVQMAVTAQNKQQALAKQSAAKQLLMGDWSTLMDTATALREGNDAADTELVRDAVNLDSRRFLDKYGIDAWTNRDRLAAAYREVGQLKNQQRTFGDTVKDTAIDLGIGAFNSALGGIQAGIESLPSSTVTDMLGVPNQSQLLYSELGALVNDWGQGLKSDLSKARDVQIAREQSLDQADSDTQYAEDGNWWAQQYRTVRDTAGNILEDPIKTGSVVAQGIGSMATISGGVAAAARTNVLANAMARGMSREEAAKFLKSASGKSLLRKEAERLAPIAVGATESGSALSQTQQSILAMTEEELQDSPKYQALRADGLSHSAAKASLASDAGRLAMGVAAPLAVVAGKVTAPFIANPLARRLPKGVPGSAATTMGGNVVKEGIEEFIQEGNAQFAQNVAQRLEAGLDVALDEGVAAAATEGMIGGLGTAGVLQAPGTALATTGEVVRVGAKGAQAAIQARRDQIENQVQESSAQNEAAQVETNTNIEAAAEQITQEVQAPQDTQDTQENQTTPNQTAPEQSQFKEQIKKAVFLAPDEAANAKQAYPALADKESVTRAAVIHEAGKVLRNSETDPASKVFAAIDVLSGLESLRSSEATQAVESVDTLSDEDKTAYTVLTEQIKRIESSPAVTQAEQAIMAMTPESLGQMLPMEEFNNGSLDPDTQAAVQSVVETIAKINPTAVGVETYDHILDQTPITEPVAEGVKQARDLLMNYLTGNREKQQIMEEQDQVIESLEGSEKEEARNQRYRVSNVTKAEVRQDILKDGNRHNNKLSVTDHFKSFNEAFYSGRMEEARDALADLRAFAESQINKINAMNASIKSGKVENYDAWGNNGFFEQEPVRIYPNKPNSVALARDVHVDMRMVAETYNRLLSSYGERIGETATALSLPQLDESVRFTPKQTQPNTNTAEKSSLETQETTAELPTTSQLDEAPSETISEPTGETITETVTEPVAETSTNVEAEQTTPTQSDEQVVSEPELEGELDAGSDQVSVVEETVETEADPEVDEDAVAEGPAAWYERAKERLVKASEGANRFVQAFRPRAQSRSSLTDVEAPAEFILNNLGSLVTERNMLKRELNASEQKAVSTIMETWRNAMEERITTILSTHQDGRLLNRLAEQGDVLDFDNGLVMNFLVEDENGDLAFDEQIFDAGFMAVIEFMTDQGSRHQPYMDDEQVNKRLGLDRTNEVTPQQRKAAQSGVPLQSALAQIASKTEALLGVVPDRSQPINLTQGMFRALAANMLEVFSEGPVLDVNSVNLDVPTSDRHPNGKLKFVTLKVNQPAENQSSPIQDLKNMPDVFSRIFLDDHGDTRYVGHAPKRVAQTQLKNPFGKLSRLEKQVIKRLQAVPFKVNEPLLNVIEALGSETYLSILGKADVDGLNKVDALSKEGKNTSLVSGINGALAYIEEARAEQADKQLNRLGDVQIFFGWMISKVGRLQQQGPITPQGNKTMRELVTATSATIDLNNAKQEQAFWLAVAQSLDIKVEKQPHLDSIQQAQDIATTNTGFEKALAILNEILETGQSTSEQSKALKDAFDESGIEMTDKAFHAAVEIARYSRAIGTEDARQFETALALEADGKTDGPINALVHMAIGSFKPKDIERLAKGGLYFTSEETSLNDFIGRDGEDLYQMAAAIFEKRLAKEMTRADMAESEKQHQHKLLRVLNAFLPDFEYSVDKETGEITLDIKRGITKNPLTVFLYGSGIRGISEKVANAALTEFYKILSEISVGLKNGTYKTWKEHPKFAENEGLGQDFSALLNTKVPSGGKKWWNSKETKALSLQTLLNNPKDAEIPTYYMRNFTSSLQRFFAKPMMDAIDETTGGLAANMKFTQKASQIQALVFQDTFNQLLNKAQQTKADQTGNPKILLSEQEMQDVFEEASKVAPIYETDAQEFHIAGGTKYGSEKKVSASIRNQLSAQATTPMPSDASVKVSPYMTIGTGDGRMILNIYANSDGSLDTSLPVFDGVELSVDTITSGSEQINEATYRAWMDGNIYESLARGFQQMNDYMTEETFYAMSQNTLDKISEILNEAPTPEGLSRMQENLQTMADQSLARKLAMSRMSSWTDHMASAMAPFGVKGEITESNDPMDYVAIADKLNEFYEEALQRIRFERTGQRSRAPIEAPQEDLAQELETLGMEVPGHPGVKELSGTEVTALMNRNEKFGTKEQRDLFSRILKRDKSLDQSRYFFGSPEALTALRDEMMSGLEGVKPIKLGQTHPGGEVFISNMSAETVLHEMLHTHTQRILQNHYQDPANSPKHVQDAVKRLEVLMDEFMELSPGMVEENVAPVLREVQSQLERLETAPASRMSEFLSWTLTNQNLIELGQRRKVTNPLVRVALKVLNGLRDLLGIRGVPGKTLFSNIRFNTEVLISDDNVIDQRRAELAIETDQILDHAYGEDPHLSRIETRFLGRLSDFLQKAREAAQSVSNPLDRAEAISRQARSAAELKRMSREAADRMIANGFHMTPREARAFQAVHAVFMSRMQLDPKALQRVNSLYRHVIQNLDETHFEDLNIAVSPRAAVYQARKALTEVLRTTANGRSDLLATFMALSQTEPMLREALKKMPAPVDFKIKVDSIDGLVNSIVSSAMNALTRSATSYRNQPRSVQGNLDTLAITLSEIQSDRQLMATVEKFRFMDRANDYVADKIKRGSESVVGSIRNYKQRNNIQGNTVRGALLNTADWVVSVANKDLTEGHQEFLTKMLNKQNGWASMRELLSDLRGQTKTTAQLMKLLNPVKASIDALRQDYRENIPKELEKAFNRTLKRREWSQLYDAIGRADIMAIGRQNAAQLLGNPAEVDNMIADLEDQLSAFASRDEPDYRRKMNALAEYMVTGNVISNNLLRNAQAIAYLYGESSRDSSLVTDDMISIIDRLTSLYAYKKLDQRTKDAVKSLMDTEPEGMKLLTGYHHSTRLMELNRIPVGQERRVSLNNAWKGYVPHVQAEGSSVRIVDDREHAQMVRMGYTRVGTYAGDPKENYRGTRSIYQSSVATRAAFRQGIAQTVHKTYSGVDVRTGQSRTGNTQGMIIGRAAQRVLGRRGATGVQDALPPGEYLLPIFDSNGALTGYERPLAPSALQGLQRDTHLGRMLGVWSGRILEEGEADKFNKDLVRTLKDIYDTQSQGRLDEFVNIADSNDPVIKDVWGTLGWQIKRDAVEIFGRPDFFPVRRDMVNDAVGYRAASITDPWTGISRLSPATQKAFREFAEIIHPGIVKYLAKAQDVVQDLVSYAKTTIIVRGVVVSLGNLVSNFLHMLTLGIDPITMVKASRDKFVEISAYVNNRDEIMRLNAQAAALLNEPRKFEEIAAQIKALEDANSRLSIKPLIDAGEFSTISENLTEADLAIREGKLSDAIEKASEKLPGFAKQLGKNLLVTKDTALFKVLNRSVQYGDFVAKAVIYDHYINVKGKSQEQTLDELSEEFVNYNKLAGRGRDYLESMGAIWFFNYKLRIMKIMMKTLRERPLSALLMGGGIGPALDIDSVMSGSLAGKVLDGGIDYSIGWEMGIESGQLNPWYQLWN